VNEHGNHCAAVGVLLLLLLLSLSGNGDE